MIPKGLFGRTGHLSTRVIFGAYALSGATQSQADQVLELLLEYGVNHIDTANMYGNSEMLVGAWMEKYRDRFFLATKTHTRRMKGVRSHLRLSLKLLRVDQIDLWQIHGLTGQVGWQEAMQPGGTLDTFKEARDKGLVRFIGVTGHGLKAPEMHLRSLEQFDFDSVLGPYDYALMQKPRYAADFESLAAVCRQRNTAFQTIKAIARRPWGDRPRTFNTYFYEPLVSQQAIDLSVHWVLGNQQAFLISAGDIGLLPKILDAASRFKSRPTEEEMKALVKTFDIRSIF
jgi:aryl-alcohol dehydrogenase-like predicted oxidoreductase